MIDMAFRMNSGIKSSGVEPYPFAVGVQLWFTTVAKQVSGSDSVIPFRRKKYRDVIRAWARDHGIDRVAFSDHAVLFTDETDAMLCVVSGSILVPA